MECGPPRLGCAYLQFAHRLSCFATFTAAHWSHRPVPMIVVCGCSGDRRHPGLIPRWWMKSSGKTGVDRDRTPSDTTDGPSAFALAAPQPQRVE